MIRRYSGLNVTKFAAKLGTKTPQTVRALLSGETRTLSDGVRYRILEAFPEINPEWLVSGSGDMLRPVTLTQQNSGGTNTQGLTVSGSDAAPYLKIIEKLTDEITAQRVAFTEALRLLGADINKQ